jgi:hypothetical protein
MDFSDHPNYADIEKERVKVFKKCKDKQKERKDGGGKCLQCIITPPVDADGLVSQPFDETRKAGHETEDWTALNIHSEVKDGVLCQYYNHRYDGASGPGHIHGARVVWSGSAWTYEEHWGYEDRNDIFDQWIVKASAGL